MSMITSATDYANRLAVQVVGASGQYTLLTCINRTADSGGTEAFAALYDDANAEDSSFFITSADRFNSFFTAYGVHGTPWGPNPVVADGSVWYWLLSVMAGDDSFATYWMQEGAGAWTNGASASGNGFADKVLNDLWLGRNAAGTSTFAGIIGPTKIWNTNLTPADLITNGDLSYREPQTSPANCVGCFKFADNGGAVDGTDFTETGDLTLVSAPVYSADEPSDILGDAPAAGTILPQMMHHYYNA